MYNIRTMKNPEKHYGLTFPKGALFIRGQGKRFVLCRQIKQYPFVVYMSVMDNTGFIQWKKAKISPSTHVLAKEIVDYVQKNGLYLRKEMTPQQLVGLASCLPKERKVGWEFRQHSHTSGAINDMEVTFHECYWSTGKNKPQMAYKPKGTKISPYEKRR